MKIPSAIALVVCLGAPVGAGAFDVNVPLRLAQRWDDLDPDQRKQAVENYQRYQTLSPEKRRSLEKRYEKWRKLSPVEKDELRKKYRGYSNRRDD